MAYDESNAALAIAKLQQIERTNSTLKALHVSGLSHAFSVQVFSFPITQGCAAALLTLGYDVQRLRRWISRAR